MKHSVVPVLFLSILLACTNDKPSAVQTPNQWGDGRLWPVLQAQEHRNTEALCALLNDSAVEVRSAAALAFASVQDSSASSCLLMALTDSSSVVRSNSAYALGFIADSLTLEAMAARALVERDSTVQRSLMSASFLAVLRSARIKDAAPLLHMLEKGKAQDRARAADALRRLPPQTLRSFGQEYLKMTQDEKDPEVKAMLIRGLGSLEGDAHIAPLTDWALQGPTPSIRISAIRSLGRSIVHGRPVAFYSLLADQEPMVRSAMLEQLNGFGDHLVADSQLTILPRLDRKDTLVRCQVLRLLVSTPRGERLALDSLRAYRPSGPYAKAEWLQAIAHDELTFSDDSLRSIMLGKDHAAVRQAAFTVLSQRVQRRMLMPRAITRVMQVREAVPFYRAVFESGDAGLISAVAEQLQSASKEDLAVLFPKSTEEKVIAALQPIRDLEALMLVEKLAQRRDMREGEYTRHGKTEGTGKFGRVPFDHPIDFARLRQLKQGQQYRIVTSIGKIIIATDVNECPSSSLAFDSLVVAGYYNGKAFHRVVPDFVAQGGCPRGDGYGGMPWTLRTEIGRTPFTAGSVGLASAGRDTESCQFFITHSAAPHLDGRYTRFGEVVSGMDVVWKLQVGDVMERVERID